MYRNQLSEGLEAGDLARLVDTKVTIDEYRSKIGSDEEIIVVSFTVSSKDPALDLMNFIEKSYDWVLDADASSGELDDGSYLVFVELDREQSAAKHIAKMLEDVSELTDIELDAWQVQYPKLKKSSGPAVDDIAKITPLTPDAYASVHRKTQEDIDRLKTAAGVKVDTRAPKNDFTESLRIAAGIR